MGLDEMALNRIMIMTNWQKHHTYNVQKKVIERSKAEVPVILITVNR